jgi:hypothetical protein
MTKMVWADITRKLATLDKAIVPQRFTRRNLVASFLPRLILVPNNSHPPILARFPHFSRRN